jgi:hypothetical protein
VYRAAALVLLALTACRVERTPQELIDPMNPALVDRREAERDVAARVGALREALARGSAADAVAALQPLSDAYVVAMDANDGHPRFGEEGVRSALGAVRVTEGAFTRMPDLRVQTDTRERMAWFATHLEIFPSGPAAADPERVRLSGVFGKLEGEWRLVQLHVSRAESAAAIPPAPPAAADSAAVRPGAG